VIYECPRRCSADVPCSILRSSSGGPGSEYTACGWGTDATDCGPREGWARDLYLQGAGSATTTISGSNSHRHLFAIAGSAVMLSDLTLANGKSSAPFPADGGSIYVLNGFLQMSRVILQNNVADFLQAAYGEGGAVLVKGPLAFFGATDTQFISNICGDSTASNDYGSGGAFAFKIDTRVGVGDGYPAALFERCAFTSNVARWGSVGWIPGGKTSILGTSFTSNVGMGIAGDAALQVNGGTIILGEGTHFAASSGNGINPVGGITYYQLPGPPGHWLPNSQCKIFRAACGFAGCAPTQESPAPTSCGTYCSTIFDACSLYTAADRTTTDQQRLRARLL
jgi:hypothetical protein